MSSEGDKGTQSTDTSPVWLFFFFNKNIYFVVLKIKLQSVLCSHGTKGSIVLQSIDVQRNLNASLSAEIF